FKNNGFECDVHGIVPLSYIACERVKDFALIQHQAEPDCNRIEIDKHSSGFKLKLSINREIERETKDEIIRFVSREAPEGLSNYCKNNAQSSSFLVKTRP